MDSKKEITALRRAVNWLIANELLESDKDLQKIFNLSGATISQYLSSRPGKDFLTKFERHFNLSLIDFEKSLKNRISLSPIGDGAPHKKLQVKTPRGYDLQPPTENSDLSFHERLRETKLFMKYDPIPSYDIDIAAASSEHQEMFDDKNMRAEDYYFIPEFSGCRAFSVFSDSMEPKIAKGSKIFARRIDDWAEVLEYGQVYAIGLHDGRRFLKIIKKGKTEDSYLLKSENPQYDDFPIKKEKIRSIWLIDGWMNKSTQSTYFVLKQPGKSGKKPTG